MTNLSSVIQLVEAVRRARMYASILWVIEETLGRIQNQRLEVPSSKRWKLLRTAIEELQA